MKILGKCALKTERLSLLREKGCTEFELFVRASTITKEYLDENLTNFKEEMDRLGMKCLSIHTPYDTSVTDKKLVALGEYGARKPILDNLDTILTVAKSLLEKDGVIIYHIGCGIPVIDNTEDIVFNLDTLRKNRMEEAESILELILKKVRATTNFKVAIENVMPFDYEMGKLTYNVIGNGYDNIKIVRKLRSKGYSEVYTLLDTCHFGASLYSINDLEGFTEVIERYKDTLIQVHLSKGENVALDRTKHGATFNSCKDVSMLTDIIRALMPLDVIVTLELIGESFDGINDYKKYENTKKLVDNVIKMCNDNSN